MMYRKIGRALAFCLLFSAIYSAFAAGLPKISITSTQNALQLSWQEWATNWVLEESPDLQAPVQWKPVASGNTSLRLNPVTNGFFRLRKLSQNVAGLSGHWEFDSGQASADDAPDGPAVAFTNATFGSGRVGPQALRFSAGTRAWVSNSNYRVLPGAGRPFSVSMWFSPDTLPIGSQYNLISNGNWSVVLQNASPGTNNILFTSPTLDVSARTLLIPREWHELTVTYDGAHGRIYLDGNPLASGSGSVTTDEQPINFGGGFLGRIDEVRTYTNALTGDQLGLTGHWPLDETAGLVVHDSSIYSHHARATAVLSSTGKLGRALIVGTNSVSIPNDHFMVVPPSGNPFSLSLWILPYSLPIGRVGLLSSGNGTNSNWDLSLEVADSRETTLVLKSSASSGTLNMRTACDLPISRWAKLDVTYNGAVATIYLNGRKLHHDSGLIQSSRAPLRIGYVPGAINFDGLIDELKTYRRERGESEIGPVATIMWETVLRGSTTNFILQGAGPAGKTLTYAILNTLTPTNGSLSHAPGSPTITYHAGTRKGPDALVFTVSDGEFTSVPASLNLSIVEPHWLSPTGGSVQPSDGSSPERAWPAPSAAALDAIWKTNNYYDCFYYAPGVYETTGCRYGTRPTALPGCKHVGSGTEGAQTTTIRLVGMRESWNEEVIFGHLHSGLFVDGFEVHNLVLDCNGNNNPKLAQGEPVWIRIPLTGTTFVHSVTLHWDIKTVQGLSLWQLGAAREFRACTRNPGTTGYTTNCVTHVSTGLVDVVSLETLTDEIVLHLDRRATNIDFYSIAEIEINGGEIRLPVALTSAGFESRLDTNNPAYSILRVADENWATYWASGSESNVQITIPVDANKAIGTLTLHWNCHTLPNGLQLGPASHYVIRARRPDGQQYDVSFIRGLRNPDGAEANTFSVPIHTDRLVVELSAKEPDVDAYSLREITLQNNAMAVPLAVPAALNSNPFNGDNSIFQAVDNAPETSWACFTQGMIGAANMVGNNLKFKGLKVIGFGTKPGRECFTFFIINPYVTRLAGNILIEDCLFTDPATNNPAFEGITCVSLFGNRGSLTNASIRRCTVRGLWPRFPFGGHAFRATDIESCLVEHCEQGVYFEPDYSIDYMGPVTIRSNRFLNVNCGLLFRFWPARQFGSVAFTDNEVALITGRGAWGFVSGDIYGPGRSASITNATVLRNVIRYADWLPRPGNTEGGIYAPDIQNAVFVNNLVALGTPSSLRVRICPLGGPLVPTAPQRCPPHAPGEPPPPEEAPPCLDILPPGYRRVWFNNHDLSGSLINVSFQNYAVDGLATQQQPPAEIP